MLAPRVPTLEQSSITTALGWVECIIAHRERYRVRVRTVIRTTGDRGRVPGTLHAGSTRHYYYSYVFIPESSFIDRAW